MKELMALRLLQRCTLAFADYINDPTQERQTRWAVTRRTFRDFCERQSINPRIVVEFFARELGK